MIVLAVDTSTSSGSVALLDNDSILGELILGSGTAHSRRLLAGMDYLMKEAALEIEEVELFAISTGPGSFTGLRVGISTIKGLAWAMNKPVVGVSSLMALAMNIPFSGLTICPILDARRGEIYAAQYRWKGSVLNAVDEAKAIPPELLYDRMTAKEVVFLGDAIRSYGHLIKENIKGAILAPNHLWSIRSSNIARLALGRCGKEYTALEIVPAYKRGTYVE